MGSLIAAGCIGLALGLLAGLVAWWWRRRRRAARLRTAADGLWRQLPRDAASARPPNGPADEDEFIEVLDALARALQGSGRQLEAERGKLAALLSLLPEGVLLASAGPQAVALNPAAWETLRLRLPPPGPPPDAALPETAGTPVRWSLLPAELQQLMAACLHGAAPPPASIELYAPRRTLRAAAAPLRLPDGDAAALVVLRDLSEARSLEVSQREFAANVSHEFRNPLASIKAMTETLQDGALAQPEMAADYLRRIQREVDRMTALTADLLELSRIEAGQLPLQWQPVDLGELAAEAAAQFAPTAQSRQVRLLVEAGGGGRPVIAQADRELLRQVLVNLVHNALKFTPDGGQVSLNAHWRPAAPAGEAAAIESPANDGAPSESPSAESSSAAIPSGAVPALEVTDTGQGIAPEHLPHIFERFYKGDRSRQDGGVGLGLAIVKEVITAHGGEVSVQSREGQGSAFRITLPPAAVAAD